MGVSDALDARDAVGFELGGDITDVEVQGHVEEVATLVAGSEDVGGVVMIDAAADGKESDLGPSPRMKGLKL